MNAMDHPNHQPRTIQIIPDPVFIIGSPRSGTTILARSLAQHSRLWTSFESDILFSLFGRGQADRAFEYTMRRPWKSWLQDQGVNRAEFLESVGNGINSLFTSRSGGRRWIDHTLIYTLMADLLAEMFPGAYFIHVLRDGRKAVNSMINLHQNPSFAAARPDSEYVGEWTRDFRSACETWTRYVEAADRFCESHPTRSLTVQNEKLAADPVEGFARILDFVCLRYEAAPAEFFRTNRINSSFQSSLPAGVASSLADPWSTWSEDQKRVFAEVAGTRMIASGLATSEELGFKGADIESAQREREQTQLAQVRDERDRTIVDLERWAHELQETALEQQRLISRYELWFGPVIGIGRLVRRLIPR